MRLNRAASLSLMAGLSACVEDTPRGEFPNTDTTDAVTAYECETELSGAEPLPSFGLHLLAVNEYGDTLTSAEDTASFEVKPDGDPTQEIGCFVYPSDHIGNGWRAEVQYNELVGQSNTVTVSFPWDETAVNSVDVWCVPSYDEREDCTEYMNFYKPDSNEALSHLQYYAE